MSTAKPLNTEDNKEDISDIMDRALEYAQIIGKRMLIELDDCDDLIPVSILSLAIILTRLLASVCTDDAKTEVYMTTLFDKIRKEVRLNREKDKSETEDDNE
jgi:hypothetical protein